MADRITGKPFATRSEVLSRNGMVASSQPLATQVGLNILKSGGNAYDAAIAVNACLGLMEPTGCGVGGDLFALFWDAKSQEIRGLNGSGRSAKGASLEDMKSALAGQGLESIPDFGPLSVSVPGCVDGWLSLNKEYGKLPMADILAPAISYAKEGFPVSELIAHYWQSSIENRKKYPGFMETFTFTDGNAPGKGDIWKNQALAATLTEIAEEGRASFYEGRIARVMADYLEQNGSFLRIDDFATHQSDWVAPIHTNYRDYDIWELPPNGQGLAALQMLNILGGYDFSEIEFGSAEHLHLFVEAKKLAFADRASLYADPEFSNVPLERLLSKEYADSQRKRIAPDTAALEIPTDPEVLSKGDTVYMCTADKEGNMVSFIQSNYFGMGSGMCAPGLGFGFQNRGRSFAMDPNHANCYAPGKRPFHTIIPAFITQDSHPLCAFGVMGGDTQPQAHVQIVQNLIDFGMNLQEAGDAPRIVHSGDSEPTGELMTDGGKVSVETGFSEDVIAELKGKGHNFTDGKDSFGGYQAIWRDAQTGVYSGASESRKDGHAAGY
ncbi:MAG: gamma-glutamyltransferase [Puniceicoccaceae bacterium]